MKILVLIPCYNEERNIIQIMKQLILTQKKINHKYPLSADILIVDDGSTDQTYKILEDYRKKPNVHIVHHRKNKGYGKTLQTGFNFAIENRFSWVISFDMDGQHEPTCLYRFITSILNATPEIGLISGSRYLDPSLFWQPPWKDRFLVNAIISGVLAELGIQVTDAFCGMKAFRIIELKKLNFELNGYEMPIEFWIKFHQNQYSFIELPVPVIYKDRREVQLKEYTEAELVQNAIKRIDKYIKIIEYYSSNALCFDLTTINDLFQDKYFDMENITADNYHQVWKEIITATQKIIKRKNFDEEVRYSCSRCSSGRC